MRLAYLILVLVLISSCQKPGTAPQPSANAKRYPFTGKVVSVDRAAKTATIDHEEIKDYMPAMTMPFPIHADWAWDELKPGAEIRAELVVDNTADQPYYLENLGIVAVADPNNPVDVNQNFAQVGQPVPDFTLTNQDGKRISTKDFRGKAWALTFIYAKCPLPEYCIKMSTNFSDAVHQIDADAELKDKVRLLSISFDPENDTPEKLRSYGLGYLGNGPDANFSIWQLAVGSDPEVKKIADFFGLRYERDANDKTVINHSLRTAVMDRDGNVVKIFAGNEWTTSQLVKELRKAAGLEG